MASNARLAAVDLINVAAEAPGAPMHMTAVAVLDASESGASECGVLGGAGLFRVDGRLALDEVREVVADRAATIPRLCRVLRGRTWVPVPGIDARAHVGHLVLPDGSGERELLALAARVMVIGLDRERPLWRLWLVTGLPERQVGLIVVLHHVVADGLDGLDLARALLGTDPSPTPAVPASNRSVSKGRASRRSVRRAITSPDGRRPRTWLRTVGGQRRADPVRLDLGVVLSVAHAQGATVNDLVLALTAAGVRALLAARGEPVDHLTLRVSVAVALPRSRVGVLLVDLPLRESPPGERLRDVAARTTAAKAEGTAALGAGFLALVARLGLARRLSTHQRLVHVVESDLRGPAEPIRLLGARLRSIVPIGPLSGNVPLSVVALSYAGTLTITLHTDTTAVPDVPVLLAALEAEWETLATTRAAQPAAPPP